MASSVFAVPIGSRVAHTLRSDDRTYCGKATPGWRLTLAGPDGAVRGGARSLSVCAKCLEAMAEGGRCAVQGRHCGDPSCTKFHGVTP